MRGRGGGGGGGGGGRAAAGSSNAPTTAEPLPVMKAAPAPRARMRSISAPISGISDTAGAVRALAFSRSIVGQVRRRHGVRPARGCPAPPPESRPRPTAKTPRRWTARRRARPAPAGSPGRFGTGTMSSPMPRTTASPPVRQKGTSAPRDRPISSSAASDSPSPHRPFSARSAARSRRCRRPGPPGRECAWSAPSARRGACRHGGSAPWPPAAPGSPPPPGRRPRSGTALRRVRSQGSSCRSMVCISMSSR